MRGIARAGAILNAKMNTAQRAFLLVVVAVFLLVIISSIPAEYEEYKFNQISASDHLIRAKAACDGSIADDGKICPRLEKALHELRAVPKSSAEYSVALGFISSLEKQQRVLDAEASANADQLKRQSFEQVQKNISGESHDAFTCANSSENTPIMSFDGGKNWWKDDGRCAEQLQRKRDSDAQLSSYWSTTLRVNTDMDSFWLPGEERTCQTYPGEKGRVATVACTSTGTRQDHNIPVKFWGGVERNTISDWKCRREGDEFVCRALD
jgi:hypothetical protein